MGRPKTFDTDVAICAARDVFWARGYEATSVDDLTRAMGLGRASLYHAFGDKHTLFLRALDRYTSERMSDLRRGLASAPSAREAIGNVLRGTVDGLWSDGERRGCLLVNSTTELAAVDPSVAMRAGEGFERVAAEFRSVLERGQHTGEIKLDVDVRAAGRYLAHTLNGLRLLAKTTDRAVADEVVDLTLTLFDLDWMVHNS
jgi:AcrR family transcriptional regulator